MTLLLALRASTTTYTGPVPIVTHVHGQNDVYSWSDGYAEVRWGGQGRECLEWGSRMDS